MAVCVEPQATTEARLPREWLFGRTLDVVDEPSVGFIQLPQDVGERQASFLLRQQCLIPHLALPRFPNSFKVIHPFSRGVVENDANCVTMTRTKAAHAVTQVDPIHPAGALHRPMVDGEHHGVTLSERDDFRA
jgi:hypothetical protein